MVGGKKIRALIDTGADVSVICKRLLPSWQSTMPYQSNLKSACGGSLKVVGKMRLGTRCEADLGPIRIQIIELWVKTI